MLIFYILFTIACCYITAYLVENHIASVLKINEEQHLELLEQLGNYIGENREQIQKNIEITNRLTNRVFYGK